LTSPNRSAPVVFRRSRRSPRLTLVPPTESDHVHDPMEGRRNQDDESEPPDPVPRPEPGDPPGGREEEQDEERADEEVVLVEARGLRAPLQAEAALHERAEGVAEERSEREEDEDPEDGGPFAEREAPARGRRNPLEDQAEDEPGGDPTREPPPRLPVPEEPASVPKGAA